MSASGVDCDGGCDDGTGGTSGVGTLVGDWTVSVTTGGTACSSNSSLEIYKITMPEITMIMLTAAMVTRFAMVSFAVTSADTPKLGWLALMGVSLV